MNPASAIILWNTVYIEKAVNYLRQTDENFNEELISNLSPLGWEHI
ncbi:Tn3 family transposase, partial [Aliarcobacter butzleri]